MAKFPDSEVTGRLGVNRIAAICARIGWIWRETPNSDVGFDGEIEIREGEAASGQIMKVQSKAGTSYIRNAKPDRFDFYAEPNDLEYWQGATNPVILVVYDPATDAAYWVDVKNYLALHPEVVAQRPHKVVFDKTRDRFTPECADALKRVFGPDYAQAEAAYRQHIIDRFCKLTLYSVTSDAPLAVDLERVFVQLTVTQPEEKWARVARELGPILRRDTPIPASAGRQIPADRFEGGSRSVTHIVAPITGSSDLPPTGTEPDVPFTVSEALRAHPRLAIIGSPGAGKTTLLKFLALTFARREAKERLQLEEDRLPIFVALRDFNRFLSNLDKQGRLSNPSPLHLPQFLHEQTQGIAPHLKLPDDFFAHALAEHRCAVLLDGLDEVADPLQRGRVAEVVANIATHYQGNRFVITSRPRGYESEARQRLAPLCAECTIRDFDDADRTGFARCWYEAVVTEREGDNETSRAKAKNSADDLLRAIAADGRITALASNPLLLSILALVHQRGLGLPQRRVDLYAECTEMLLGYWDQVRGGEAARELASYGGLDRQEKRALLEPIALWLHERGESEPEVVEKELVAEIAHQFRELFGDPEPQSYRRAELFLHVITERAGLLVERETGVFGFAHLTFQEYLAARALADRDEYITATLRHLHDPWWREVTLLEIGHLGSFNSRQGRARTTALIQAIRQANSWLEDVLKRDLLLACRSLVDVSQLGVDEKLRQAAFEDLFALWQTTTYTPQRSEVEAIFAYAGSTSDGECIRRKLVILLGDQDISVRFCAAGALGKMGAAAATPETVARLVELVRDPSEAVRGSAAYALGLVGAAAATPETLARLVELIRDPSEDVRDRAVYALWQVGAAATTPETVARLVELSRDPSGAVRFSAAGALGQMGAAAATPETVARLVELVRDPSEAVRRSAADALGEMGAAAATPETVTRLVELIRDPSEAVRGSAAHALGQVGAAAMDQHTVSMLAEFWSGLLSDAKVGRLQDDSDQAFSELQHLASHPNAPRAAK